MPRMARRSERSRALSQRARDEANRVARNFSSRIAEFEDHMRHLELETCSRCLKRTTRDDLTRNTHLCRYCRRTGNNLFSPENGMDLGDVPLELQDLTIVEQLLISRVYPIVSVFNIRGQQRGYSGHVMNFVQHMDRIATRMPPPLSELTGIVLLTRDTPSGLVQFRVRAEKVKKALIWLKQNNQYYRDIIIDRDALDSLPTDADVTSMLPVVSNVVEPQPSLDQADNLIHASCFPHIPPIDAAQVIANNLRRVPITQGEAVDVGDWPDVSPNPVDEFRLEGYICKAFPVLFPYGRGDLNAPRINTIQKHKYFKYLMKYRDGRFANDLRFPYYAYNTLARWDALNCGNVFVRMNRMEGFSADDIAELAQDDDRDLASSIMYYGCNLRGTRAFWKQRCAELVQMVRQLGIPTIFFTLSAADYHWPDLFRILRPNDNINTLTEVERRKIMHENPATVAWFFNQRSDAFMKKFMTKFFAVADFWYRFEWQHRGSPHIHGVIWLTGAPDCTNIDSMTVAERANIAAYFDDLVQATLDERLAITNTFNPCRVRYTDLPPAAVPNDLNRILNAVQRHSRCGSHCMRRVRGSREMKCRFGFPHQLEDQSSIRLDAGSWKFFPKRNDDLLQRYNKAVSQAWRGNTDFSAITSKDAVINYISKYATKGEYSSEAYSEILRRVINRNPSDAPAARLIRQLLVSSVAERNYSAQEVMHLLQGWPLYHASRSMVVLSLRDEWQRLGAPEGSTSMLKKYARREAQHDDITLYEYAKKFHVRGGKSIERRKECIVRVVPFLKLTQDPDTDEEYYRQQCQLHIPWRNNFDDILPNDTTWYELFLTIDQDDDSDEFGQQFPHQPDDVVYSDASVSSVDRIRDANMAASRLHPGVQPEDPLGQRVMDEAHVWHDVLSANINPDDINELLRSVSTRHGMVDVRSRTSDSHFIHARDMSASQREVIELCQEQARSFDHRIKRVIIQGKAGTGKSAVIKAMCHFLDDCPVFPRRPYEILAPTGAAAVNIDGKTLHSFFRLPLSGPMAPLNGEALRLFQLHMKDIKYIIIDEYSMIGMRLLHKIHNRLCEARGSSEEYFGGYYVYLFGDLRQLPPVKDLAIYAEPTDDFSRFSIDLINSFDKTIVLSQVYRQDPSQSSFKRALDNIGRACVTTEDWNLLLTRRAALRPQNLNEFKDATHLFPLNKSVDEYNSKRLAQNRLPVAIVEAVHNNATARQSSDTLAGGLARRLLLSIGCRVMLRKNICVEKGLVNGSLGSVADIIYHPNQRPPTLPYIILIKFDKYSGPYFRDGLFPLLPSSASWKESGVDCTRRQFPVNLAYALTIHKSQGLTLDKAVVEIGDKEIAPGLTYVALSRVRRLEDLLFSRPFNFTRLSSLRLMKQVIARERFMQQQNEEP